MTHDARCLVVGRLISFDEFTTMVRKQLRLSGSALPAASLRSVWLALDDDGSGHVTAGEFGKFMRRGAEPFKVDRHAARQRVFDEKREKADAVRREKELLTGQDVIEVARGDAPASDETVTKVAVLLNVRLRQLYVDPSKRSWFKLFREVDTDGSGLISFDEFTTMVRKQLQLSARELPAASLRSVWLALDDDGSGHVTAGEFGKFMRRGEPSPSTSMHSVQSDASSARASLRWRRWTSPLGDRVGGFEENAAHSVRTELEQRKVRVEQWERELAKLHQQLHAGGATGGGATPRRAWAPTSCS